MQTDFVSKFQYQFLDYTKHIRGIRVVAFQNLLKISPEYYFILNKFLTKNINQYSSHGLNEFFIINSLFKCLNLNCYPAFSLYNPHYLHFFFKYYILACLYNLYFFFIYHIFTCLYYLYFSYIQHNFAYRDASYTPLAVTALEKTACQTLGVIRCTSGRSNTRLYMPLIRG